MKNKKRALICAVAFTSLFMGAYFQKANAENIPVLNLPNGQKVEIPSVTTQQTNSSTLGGAVVKNQNLPSYSTMTSSQLNNLVSDIGNKILTANSVTTKVNFVLIDQDVENAYTDIQDTVAVYTGIIKRCENEDELAFVIGHEIGHAASNHVIKGVVTGVVADTGASVAKVAAKNALGKAGIAGKLSKISAYTGVDLTKTASSGIDMTKTAGTKKVGRIQENNADELGVDFLVKAGYNPLAGISIMNKIGENYKDFWADHPSTDKRILNMYKYVQDKYPQYIKQGFDTAAYQDAMNQYVNNKL